MSVRHPLSSIAALSLLAAAAGCSGHLVAETGGVAEKNASPSQSIEFQISGMNCKSCERKIEQAVATLDGVLDVEARQDEARLVVTLDPARVTPRTIESQIERMGHEAVLRTGTESVPSTSSKTY